MEIFLLRLTSHFENMDLQKDFITTNIPVKPREAREGEEDILYGVGRLGFKV